MSQVTTNDSVTDDRSQIPVWLSPLEPKLRYQELQETQVDIIGGLEWLIQTEEFRTLHDRSGNGGGSNCVLFFYGDSRVIKTFTR